jgi:hypothetical protein
MFKKVLIIIGVFMSVATAQLNLEKKKILIVYYSWGGDTKDIALKVKNEVGGEIFELVQEKPYSDDYKEATKIH